jgi:hypothetical protein
LSSRRGGRKKVSEPSVLMVWVSRRK